MTITTWIETPARGRHGGPIRAGQWAVTVLGTHPIAEGQQVWLELRVDGQWVGRLPAFWQENRGGNSYWHVPIPPQNVAARLQYWAVVRTEADGELMSGPDDVQSAAQEAIVRPNLPDQTGPVDPVDWGPEGLVGNGHIVARVDRFGATYDLYFPTVGLHSNVRPAAGDLPQSRTHFRQIVGGLAVGGRLDWFTEPTRWKARQRYRGATNTLVTELSWRHGPIQVVVSDLAICGTDFPCSREGQRSPGQYLKRFRILNRGPQGSSALFGLFVHAEVNGGIGEPRLIWIDEDDALLACNRGHSHSNQKLARNATIEFAIAMDRHGEVHCEPTSPNEAMLLRWVELPAGQPVVIDAIVSGAFTGWRGDAGTYQHWLQPALAWFHESDPDQLEQATAATWEQFLEPVPRLTVPSRSDRAGRDAGPPQSGSTTTRPPCEILRRAVLAAALHVDREFGAVTSGYDRGISAYCWPRDAIYTALALGRVGHHEIAQRVFAWLDQVRDHNRIYKYWFQKYSIDGIPEWESPAIDQSALIAWGLERHYRRTGDPEFLETFWPMVKQSAQASLAEPGHPGLRWLAPLRLVSSAGLWDTRFGAYCTSNAAVVAGLRAACRIAEVLGFEEAARPWASRAEVIWNEGILASFDPADPEQPGLFDPTTGRFLEARRISTRRGIWAEETALLQEANLALDIALLALQTPLNLLPAADPRIRRTAEAILQANGDPGRDPRRGGLVRWLADPEHPEDPPTSEQDRPELSSLATLWMARYLFQLGRETGQADCWDRAWRLLEVVLDRLGPLGLLLRPSPFDPTEGAARVHPDPAAWGLHASLIETFMEIHRLDYDAPDRTIQLDPILPPGWPHVGIDHQLPCGRLKVRLERRVLGRPHYDLLVHGTLENAVTLEAAVTCPDLDALHHWEPATQTTPPPERPQRFQADARRLTWTTALPAGAIDLRWAWS